jgi:hypothetical protein
MRTHGVTDAETETDHKTKAKSKPKPNPKLKPSSSSLTSDTLSFERWKFLSSFGQQMGIESFIIRLPEIESKVNSKSAQISRQMGKSRERDMPASDIDLNSVQWEEFMVNIQNYCIFSCVSEKWNVMSLVDRI